MPRQKEQELPEMKGPGVESVEIEEIDEAADDLEDLQEKRSKMAEKCTAAEKKLLELMEKNKLTKYRYRNRMVTYKPGKDHVKVTTVRTGDSNGEAD